MLVTIACTTKPNGHLFAVNEVVELVTLSFRPSTADDFGALSLTRPYHRRRSSSGLCLGKQTLLAETLRVEPPNLKEQTSGL
jgi:hypothetical protein